MGAYKNKQAVKSLLLIGVVLVVSVVTYISWISWYTHKYKNMENTYIRCIMENVINQYPDLDMEEIAIILNKSYSELESSTTSEEFDSILRKNGITDNTFYIKDMSDIRNVNIIVSTSIIGVMSVLFIICFCMYLRRRKKDIFELQDYMDKISRGNYELEINDNSEDELSSLKNSLYKIMVYMKEQADSARIKKVMLAQSVSDISHQLKTPLTSTQVLLDNLNDNPDMDYSTRKKFIYEALNQVNGMSWMIVSMLKLSRIDAGVVEFNNENISINKIIEEAVGNLEVIAEIKNVNIEKNIYNRNEDELNKSDIYIKGDYNWNREALQNIIKNAIEHSNDKGTVKINITDNDVYTAVYITNRGEKLSDKQQKQIFERYYSEAKYEDNSMGIGLPLAKAVIEKQGGYISVESDDEETVFIVKYIK
jgi:signal transduction histidine kinase